MPQGWTSSVVERESFIFKPLDDLDQHAALRDENFMMAMFPGRAPVKRDRILPGGNPVSVPLPTKLIFAPKNNGSDARAFPNKLNILCRFARPITDHNLSVITPVSRRSRIIFIYKWSFASLFVRLNPCLSYRPKAERFLPSVCKVR